MGQMQSELLLSIFPLTLDPSKEAHKECWLMKVFQLSGFILHSLLWGHPLKAQGLGCLHHHLLQVEISIRQPESFFKNPVQLPVLLWNLLGLWCAWIWLRNFTVFNLNMHNKADVMGRCSEYYPHLGCSVKYRRTALNPETQDEVEIHPPLPPPTVLRAVSQGHRCAAH